MIDFDQLKEKYQLVKDASVVVKLSLEHLEITIDSTGYYSQIDIKDTYVGDMRNHSLSKTTQIENVIEREREIAERVDQAKELEYTETINGWTQVETARGEFIKFVNATEELTIRLSETDTWLFNAREKESIQIAKYRMVQELQSRNIIEEKVNEEVQKMLEEELQKIKGIGDSIASKMANRAVSIVDGQIETIEDIQFSRPKNVKHSVKSDAEQHFRKMDGDPVKQIVQETKRELVTEHEKQNCLRRRFNKTNGEQLSEINFNVQICQKHQKVVGILKTTRFEMHHLVSHSFLSHLKIV